MSLKKSKNLGALAGNTQPRSSSALMGGVVGGAGGLGSVVIQTGLTSAGAIDPEMVHPNEMTLDLLMDGTIIVTATAGGAWAGEQVGFYRQGDTYRGDFVLSHQQVGAAIGATVGAGAAVLRNVEQKASGATFPFIERVLSVVETAKQAGGEWVTSLGPYAVKAQDLAEEISRIAM